VVYFIGRESISWRPPIGASSIAPPALGNFCLREWRHRKQAPINSRIIAKETPNPIPALAPVECEDECLLGFEEPVFSGNLELAPVDGGADVEKLASSWVDDMTLRMSISVACHRT
jgi:hypothetical protein